MKCFTMMGRKFAIESAWQTCKANLSDRVVLTVVCLSLVLVKMVLSCACLSLHLCDDIDVYSPPSMSLVVCSVSAEIVDIG